MSGSVRCYRPGDEILLAPRLRKADLQEIEASTGQHPIDALQEGAEASLPSCTIIDGHGSVVGMFGVVPRENGIGRIWLMGSDELTKPPLSRQFLRECKCFLRGIERTYSATGNVIDARNTVHIRWLRWLGYIFLRRIPEYGVERREFIEFIKLKEQ